MNTEFRSAPLVAKRYYGIDILRGIAAFSVLIFHYRNFFVDPTGILPTGNVADFPLADILLPLNAHGYLAVQLFWVISGFVLCHVYGQRADVGFEKFALSRFARLYPVHFVTVLTCLALQTVSFLYLGRYQIYPDNDAIHFVLHIFMASGWEILPGGSFNAPAWSVSAKVLSYLIFGLLCGVSRCS